MLAKFVFITRLALYICLLTVCCTAGPTIFDEQKNSWDIIETYPSSIHLPKPTATWKDANTAIYVGISHYRDSRCAQTLKNIFSKAEHPDRIYVGIIQYIHMEQDHLNCLRDYCKETGKGLDSGQCPHAVQVRIVDVSFKDARGPGTSRYLQQNLQNGEEFCLQIDAHSDFIHNWDTNMLNTWAATDNEYAVLSTRPPDITELTSAEDEINHVCQVTFGQNGIPRNLLPRRVRGLKAPLLAPLWSAAFSFSKCHAMEKAPYDPNLPFIYDGEEFLQMAKLWTRGYDVYSPHRVLVVHDDKGKMKGYKSPEPFAGNRKLTTETEWAANGQTPEFRRMLYDEAVQRIKTILDMEGGVMATSQTLASLQRYGLGSKRTLDDFLHFTGVDTRQGILFADACEARKWVAFVPDSEPSVVDGDAWGMRAEVLPAGGIGIPLVSAGNVDIVVGASGSGSPPTLPIVSTTRTIQRKNPLAQYPLLWGLFLPVDEAVEGIVSSIREHSASSRNAAIRAIKLSLLLLPVVLILVIIAILTSMGESLSSFFGVTDEPNSLPPSKLQWEDEQEQLSKKI